MKKSGMIYVVIYSVVLVVVSVFLTTAYMKLPKENVNERSYKDAVLEEAYQIGEVCNDAVVAYLTAYYAD